MTVTDRIINFNKERNIPQKFDTDAEFWMLREELGELYNAKTDEERVDALCDLIVIATGGLWKLGMDHEIAMDETLLEIEDRTGEFNPITGKWNKILRGDEYKADYARAIAR